MYKPLLLWFFALCLSVPSLAQNNRTIDGTQNNLSHTDWGAADEPLQKFVSNGYEDGISSPAGSSRPNPRMVSNLLFDQSSSINDALLLSDYVWVFGQFIDHDIIAVEGDPTEPAHIPVDFDDPDFNPSGTIPGVVIPMFRSAAAEGTGTDSSNPRNHLNEITSWIDGSGVYGSDLTRANWLRTFSDGKMKTSGGNLLPYNTTTGEFDDPVDALAPSMADDVGFATRLFVAGDVRANEQPLLLACHTLFVREHNRLCEEIIADHPSWTDEEIYQYARKKVGALIQAVVYEEWIPAMGIHLPAYTGYDETVDGTIANVFSAAAFRLGHTLLNSNILRLDNNGEEIPEGNMTLQHAFFNPAALAATGIDVFFKGMATQVEQELDCKVIDDVRNFLFGPPGAGGLDLAAININRGRERGLPHFNQVRQDLGLSPFATFSELNPDSTIYIEMENTYPDINDVDPWVGMLAEDHMANALFGETVMEIMIRQFGALRDGDRFYYENDPVLTEAEIAEIKSTSFRMIIMRNTGIELMQENIFLAMPHDSICNPLGLTSTISGAIADANNASVANVDLVIRDIYNATSTTSTGSDGLYTFPDLGNCSYYRVRPERDGDDRNGINILDIILTSRHLIGVEPFDSPYDFIAADVDRNGFVNTFDIIGTQKLLLYFDDTYPSNTSWRFVDADYIFSDPQNPLSEDFPEYRLTDMLNGDEVFDFAGIKVGDLNGSANPAAGGPDAGDRDQTGLLTFETSEQIFEAGEWVNVHLEAKDLADMLGYQFTLDFDPGVLEFVALKGLSTFSSSQEKGQLALLWNSYTAAAQSLDIQFKTLVAGRLSDVLTLNSNALAAEAYDQNLNPFGVALEIMGNENEERTFELYQNQPNPFSDKTYIGFFLPERGATTLRIYDVSGQELGRLEKSFTKGFHQLELAADYFSQSGIYYYQLTTSSDSQIKKMIKTD